MQANPPHALNKVRRHKMRMYIKTLTDKSIIREFQPTGIARPRSNHGSQPDHQHLTPSKQRWSMTTCSGTTRSRNSPAHTYSSPSNTTMRSSALSATPTCTFQSCAVTTTTASTQGLAKPRAAARPNSATGRKTQIQTAALPSHTCRWVRLLGHSAS